MQYLTSFFVSIFGNNLLLTGVGTNTLDESTKVKKTGLRFVLFLFYILQALIVGALAYCIPMIEELANFHETYFLPLLIVLVLAITTGIFYAIIYASPKLRASFKGENIALLLNTSLFAIAMTMLSLVRTSDDYLLLIANCCGYPLGYVLSFVVFEPVAERIKASNAMRGFKGAPLVIITLACVILSFASLTF